MLKWILLTSFYFSFFGFTQQNEVVEICLCDVEAQFPGGSRELSRFIQENIQPIAAKTYYGDENKRMYVSFVVDELGKISNVQIERGFCKEVDEEIIRVIYRMPTWIPHSSGCGELFKTNIRMPISVTLI